MNKAAETVFERLVRISFEKDYNSFLNTSATFVYKRFYQLSTTTAYLKQRIAVHFTRTVAQIRLFNVYAPILLNGKRYVFYPNEKCKLCSTGEPDEMLHLLESCPAVLNLRMSFAEKLGANIDSQTWNYIFNCDNIYVIKSLVIFTTECLERREILIQNLL